MTGRKGGGLKSFEGVGVGDGGLSSGNTVKKRQSMGSNILHPLHTIQLIAVEAVARVSGAREPTPSQANTYTDNLAPFLLHPYDTTPPPPLPWPKPCLVGQRVSHPVVERESHATRALERDLPTICTVRKRREVGRRRRIPRGRPAAAAVAVGMGSSRRRERRLRRRGEGWAFASPSPSGDVPRRVGVLLVLALRKQMER